MLKWYNKLFYRKYLTCNMRKGTTFFTFCAAAQLQAQPQLQNAVLNNGTAPTILPIGQP